MKKYRKKPIVIEAEQWLKVTYDREAKHGFTEEDMPIYHLGVGYYRTPELDGKHKCKKCGKIMHVHGWIDIGEDGITVCPNDWIINGVKGEFQIDAIKPDIFEANYEEVKE